MLYWIEAHPILVQALSSVVIAGLTLVLIALSCVYARANWKTMRLMEADIRFRTEPIPKVSLEVAENSGESSGASSFGGRTIRLVFTTANAPMVIKDLRLSVSFQSGAHKDFHLPVRGMVRLPLGDEYDLDTEIPALEPVEHWSLNLDYWDLTGKIEYRTWFGPNGSTFSYGPKGATSLRKTLSFHWHRIRGHDPVAVGHGEIHTSSRHR